MTYVAGNNIGAEAYTFVPSKKRNRREDLLSREGAMALAQRLEKYWHDRGYFMARFWAQPIEERFEKLGTHEIYRVASNLVNGLPPTSPRQSLC